MSLEGYNSIPENAKENEGGLDKSYIEKATVNGKEISVVWDTQYDEYSIYFPQIHVGDEASEKDVNDQIIMIGQNPKVAKEVFDYASQLAKTEADVYEIYKAIKKLPQLNEEY